jgi:hypothetical protein
LIIKENYFKRIATLNKNGHFYTIGDTYLDFDHFIQHCGIEKIDGVLNYKEI